jgi:hypothetical protein
MTETTEAPPPQVRTIEYGRNRLTVNFFKQSHGAEVYIDGNGKFYVCIAGVWTCKPSLNKVEREIINFARGVGIKVFYQDSYEKVHVEEIIGVQGSRIIFRSGNSCSKHSFSLYRFEEKLMKKCADYWKRKSESDAKFEKEWDKISANINTVSGHSIERLLAEEAQKKNNEAGTNPS